MYNGMYKHQAWLTVLMQTLLLALRCGLRRDKLQFSHSSSEALLQERRGGEGVQSWLLSPLPWARWADVSGMRFDFSLRRKNRKHGLSNKCSWILTCSLCYGFTVIPQFFSWEKMIKRKIKENFLLKPLPFCSITPLFSHSQGKKPPLPHHLGSPELTAFPAKALLSVPAHK